MSPELGLGIGACLGPARVFGVGNMEWDGMGWEFCKFGHVSLMAPEWSRFLQSLQLNAVHHYYHGSHNCGRVRCSKRNRIS